MSIAQQNSSSASAMVPPRGVAFSPWLVGAMLVVRTVLFLVAFFIVVWIMKISGDRDAFAHARAWWPVAGIAVNVVCFGLLSLTLSREQLSVLSLLGFYRQELGSDVIRGLWYIGVSIVLAVGATFGFGWILYGSNTPSGLMSLSALPLWALVVGVGIFPITNAFVEQMTYNGYCYNRIQATVASRFTAILLVTFVFSLQHIALPFAFDVKFLFWRFLSFVPLLLFWVVAYSRLLRLTPLLLSHWFMDVFAILSILFIPMS